MQGIVDVVDCKAEGMSKRKFDDAGESLNSNSAELVLKQFRAALEKKMKKYFWKPQWIVLALEVFDPLHFSTIRDEKAKLPRKFRPEKSSIAAETTVYYWGARIQSLTALKLDFEKMELSWVKPAEQFEQLKQLEESDKSDKSNKSDKFIDSWPVAKKHPLREDGPHIKWDKLDYYENEMSNSYRLLFEFVSDDPVLDDVPLNLWISIMEEIYHFFKVPCWSERDFRCTIFPEFCHYYSLPQHRISLPQHRVTQLATSKIDPSVVDSGIIWGQGSNEYSHQGKSDSAYYLDQLYAPMINYQFKTATDAMFSVLPLQEQMMGRKFIEFLGSIQNTPDSYFPHWTTKSKDQLGAESGFLEACHFLGDWTFGPSSPSHLRSIATINPVNAIGKDESGKLACYTEGQFGWCSEEIQVRQQIAQFLRKVFKCIHYYDFCPGKPHLQFDAHVKETGISLDLCAQIMLCQIICLAESANSDNSDSDTSSTGSISNTNPFAKLNKLDKSKKKKNGKLQNDYCDEEFPTLDDHFSNLSDVRGSLATAMQKTTIHSLTHNYNELTRLITSTIQTGQTNLVSCVPDNARIAIGVPIPVELSKMIMAYVPFVTVESLQSFVPTFPLSSKYSNTRDRYLEFNGKYNHPLDKEAHWQVCRVIETVKFLEDPVTKIPLFLPLVPTKI